MFLALAALVVGAAVMVLRARELIHGVVWLAAVLLGVAGVFLTVGAEFLAVIQVLVYVGAVITLILFTVMLTVPEERIELPEGLHLPPGVTIESVEDIQSGMPAFTGVGPYRHLEETNPRRPQRKPDTLYGVTLADNEYATEKTDRSKKEGAS